MKYITVYQGTKVRFKLITVALNLILAVRRILSASNLVVNLRNGKFYSHAGHLDNSICRYIDSNNIIQIMCLNVTAAGSLIVMTGFKV